MGSEELSENAKLAAASPNKFTRGGSFTVSFFSARGAFSSWIVLIIIWLGGKHRREAIPVFSPRLLFKPILNVCCCKIYTLKYNLKARFWCFNLLKLASFLH